MVLLVIRRMPLLRSTVMVVIAHFLLVARVRMRPVAMICEGDLRRATALAKIAPMNAGSLRPCNRHNCDEQQYLAQ